MASSGKSDGLYTTLMYIWSLCLVNGDPRVLEGAAGNLPDCRALGAAHEILALCREAREGDIVVALISGGGSALLPCPIEGVRLEEKRTVTYYCMYE